jgi:ankyrin repeat protein
LFVIGPIGWVIAMLLITMFFFWVPRSEWFSGLTGLTPLHWAAEAGNVEKAKRLIADGADANARNRNGDTPLHFAARAGKLEMVRLLVGAGADCESKGCHSATPLHQAIASANPDIVEYLLSVGANPNITNSRGLTPLALGEKLLRDKEAARFINSDERTDIEACVRILKGESRAAALE